MNVAPTANSSSRVMTRSASRYAIRAPAAPQAVPRGGAIAPISLLPHASGSTFAARQLRPLEDCRLGAEDGGERGVQRLSDGTDVRFVGALVKEFSDWVLSADGQKVIAEVGYYPLKTAAQ